MSKIWSIIFQSYGGWEYDDSNQTDLPEATTNLVAAQTNYSLDAQMLTVNRVEVTDTGGNVRRLEPLVQETVEGTGLSNLTPAAYGNPQFYRLTAGMIQVLPAPQASVTNGLCVYFERAGVAFVSTDTTKQPGFASTFHYMVPLGTEIDWLKSKQADSATLPELKEDWTKAEADLREYYQQRWRDHQPRVNTPQTAWN